MPGQATTASGQNITGTPRNDLWQILLSFRLLGGVSARRSYKGPNFVELT